MIEYYFYLTAFIDDKDVQKDLNVSNDFFPTIYRIDRIKKLRVLDERFHIPYSSLFGEASSGSGYSLCTEENCRRSSSDIQDRTLM